MDQNTLLIILCILFAYLLGSIPTAVWVGKLFFGIDVREHGSGNAGATNTFRVLGKPAGIFVLLSDCAKGFAATSLAWQLLNRGVITSDHFVSWQLALGLLSVVGHVFPVFAGFRGGKGVATLLGMVISLHPQAASGCVIVFLLFFLSLGYVSVGSMMAALAFPIQILAFHGDIALVVFGFITTGAVIATHHKNIKRLIDGNESKLRIWNNNRQHPVQ